MKLRFTEGYRPRFDQISRIMQFLLSQEERKKIPRQDIIAALGIQNKQIENLISMMIGFGLVQPRVTILTPFGKAITQSDPYFEKIESIWMIHYIVSSNPEWVVWYRIINKVIPIHDHISVEFICNHYFSDLAIHFSEKTISNKLPHEVSTVLGAYTRTELSHLNILSQEGAGNFIRTNPVEIPDSAFLYCLLRYRDKYSPGSSAMNTADVCLAENSPGRVFNLPEYQVITILGNLHNAGLVRLEQLANLDQVRLFDTITQDSVLQHIYGGKDVD
jgi:hypothetical protein